MPTAVERPTGLFDHELTWTDEDGYEVADGEILQQFVREHADRHDDDFSLSWHGDALTFSFPDETGPQNRYRVESDGTISSGYGIDGETTGIGRHETLTEHRFNALVGRANKTAELIDHIEECEQFGVAETVYRRLCEEPIPGYPDKDDHVPGPRTDSPDMAETIIKQEHGQGTLDSIMAQKPYLINRVGEADIDTTDEDDYNTVLDMVIRGERYTGELPQAVKMDYEICTKGRDLSDWYDPGISQDRKDARHTHRTVMKTAAEHLGMEHIYDDVMNEYWLVHGNWPR